MPVAREDQPSGTVNPPQLSIRALSFERYQPPPVNPNGREVKLERDDSIPRIGGVNAGGKHYLPPASITFLAIPKARKAGCREQR